MPFVSGFLRVRERGHPDQGLPGGPSDYPDQGLPGDQPYPDQGLPVPPPGVWPPPTVTHPIVPAPGVPPGSIWPPVPPPVVWPRPPGHPDQGLPPSPGTPDQGLPPAAGHPDQGLPRPETFWVVCGIPGVGWRYVAVDPSLRPDQGLPPTAQPK
jgi:hypothetical protein